METIEVTLPDDLLAKIDVCAAMAGTSVGACLLRMFERAASVPTDSEIRERLHALPPWPVVRIVTPVELDFG